MCKGGVKGEVVITTTTTTIIILPIHRHYIHCTTVAVGYIESVLTAHTAHGV